MGQGEKGWLVDRPTEVKRRPSVCNLRGLEEDGTRRRMQGKAVTERGQMCLAKWRRKEKDGAKNRKEKKVTKTDKALVLTVGISES